MKTQTLATLVGLGTLTIGTLASADLITFVAEGDITSLIDPANLTDSARTWSWTYSFDSDALDQLPGDREVGLYALGDWELTLGTLTVNSTGDIIRVFDDLAGFVDGYQVGSVRVPPAGWALFDVIFILGTTDLSTFSSDALPLTPPNPADFEDRIFSLAGVTVGTGGDTLIVEGVVTSIVPAPSALALLGLAGLLGTRRRRRQ